MKRININKNIFKKGRLVLVTVPIVATLTLSGCNFGANGERARYSNTGNTAVITDDTINNDQNNSAITSSESTDIQTDKLNIPLKNIGDKDLRGVKLNYNNNNNVNFEKFLDSVNIVYEYESLYNFEEALNEYNKLNLTKSHQLKLKNLNYNELEKIILENNKLFKEKNSSSIYRELSKNERKMIINTIITTVNDFASKNEDISIDRIKCVLGDLKLFVQKSALSNAFVTNDNCLVISPNMIKFANTINGDGTYEDILKHEIIHLLQKGCNCDLKNNSNLKRNFGVSYGFNNIELNSLQFSWLYEASAEKNMVNYTGHDALVYKNMIGYLESLSITNLIKNDYKVNDTENLSFKRSLNDLYDYFGVTTEKDKKEILNFMYSLEIMQVCPDDFYKILEEKTGDKKNAELIDKVNYTVKSSICETLSKQFYKNLSVSIINKDVSLGDIFYLISIFENDINNHILYNSPQKYNYNQKFINTYLNIQDNFFFELSKNLNVSQDELENLYNNYTSQIKLGESIVENYDLKFLSNEKKEYINDRKEFLKNITAPTIRLTNEKILNNKTKKVYN